MSRDEDLAVAPDVEAYINCGDTDLARIGNRSLFPEVTAEVEAAIRETESECYVSSRGGSGRRIHLPAEEASEPLCEQGDSLLDKPLAAYPPGYLDICVTCATMWRYREHGVRDETEVPELASTDEEAEVAADGGQSTDETEQKPFERVRAHRDVLKDVEQMRDNLDELEAEVRRAEWVALGGRGWVDLEKVDKLCEAVGGSMPYIREDIHELNRSVDTGNKQEGSR